MNDKELDMIGRVLETLSTGAADIVATYSTWMYASAITWLIIGSILFLIGVVAIIIAVNEGAEALGGVGIFVVLVGMVFIGANVPDLVSPKAAATHQLIKDIRGGNK